MTINVKLLTTTVANDNTGTTTLPNFITVAPGEKRGRDFIMKVGTMTYSSHVRKENNGVCNMRCKNWRVTQCHDKCCWTAKVMNVSGLNKTDEGYWNDENWIVLSHRTAQNHTCCGVPIYKEAMAKYRKFVKDEARKGHMPYNQIRLLSGVDNKYHDLAGLYIGDDKSYQNTG